MTAYPNLYIVGAPKSGTTSLYHYLNQHPDICIPDKEPRFFIREIINKVSEKDPVKPYLLRSSTLDLENYVELYNNRTEKIRCDSSTQYLFHYKEVIPQIKALDAPEPKILVLLRNPVDRAFSNYQHNLATFETLSFEQSIKEEKNRINHNYNSFWYYTALSQYADSVKAYLESFQQVKVIFFEDFTTQTNDTLKEIFAFLEVDARFNPSHFLVNKKSTGTPKSKWLNALFRSVSGMTFLKRIFYACFGKEKTRLIREIAFRKNLTKSKNKLSAETRHQLNAYFKEDILKLKEILPLQNISWFRHGADS